MLGYIILGMLAAFGTLSALWAVFGWLLPGLEGCVLVCWGVPEEEIFTKYELLKGLGILFCPFLVVTEGQYDWPDMEICRPEALPDRLKWERKRFDGTGNGDYTGNHQYGGISEL